jgi:diguanylate cyclase (GGDEF)-like protein
METGKGQSIQLPTQASVQGSVQESPGAGLPRVNLPADPSAAPPADPFVAQTTVAEEAAPPAGGGWGSDILLAGLLLLLILLALAAVRILRLAEALRTAHEDELAAATEARDLRSRLTEAEARQSEAAQARTTELARTVDTLTRERDELQRTNRLLQGMVRCDTVTGLANGPFLARQLAKELRRAMRTRQALSLLVCDIDAFAAYNRAHGHEEGDALLKRIGGLLGTQFQRGGDLVARLDADRFAVIMPATSAEKVAALAARLEQAVAEAAIPHGASPYGPMVGVSVGVACATSSKLLHPHQLLATATEALVAARRAAGKAAPARHETGDGAKSASDGTRTAGTGRKAPVARKKKTAARKKAGASKAKRGKAPAGTTTSKPPAKVDEPTPGELFPEQAAGQS